MAPRQTLHHQTAQNQSHKLMVTPQMRQALNALQMPLLELTQVIEAELAYNPLLELEETQELSGADAIVNEALNDDAFDPLPDPDRELRLNFSDEDFRIFDRLDEDYKRFFFQDDLVRIPKERQATATPTPFEALLAEAHLVLANPAHLEMAEAIIGNLDSSGMLGMPLEEVGPYPTEELQLVLETIQTIGPRGIAARDLRECLLLQLTPHTLAYDICDTQFNHLLLNQIPAITRALKVRPEEIQTALSQISKCNFYPGSEHVDRAAQPITPDLIIDDDLQTRANHSDLPTLRLNWTYFRLLQDPSTDAETRQFIKTKLTSAKWLLRTIGMRTSTLERIGHYLTEFQADYLQGGLLRPMTMHQVADALDLAESTIARAVSGKYLSSPRGTQTLRSLFTTAYHEDSAHTVKEILQEIVGGEDKHSPLSDQKIAQAIEAQGITIARRTIAKYRTQLNIPRASQRKVY